MKEMRLDDLLSRCEETIEQVRVSGESVRIVREGQVLVDIRPVRKSWLGRLEGPGVQITGDIISPVVDPEDWEALRD